MPYKEKQTESLGISIAPTLTEEEVSDLPLPYLEGTYGPEVIEPHHHVLFSGASLLVYPAWIFGPLPAKKTEYIEALKSHIESSRQNSAYIREDTVPELVEQQIRLSLPSAVSPKLDVPALQNVVESAALARIKSFVTPNEFGLDVNPPLGAPPITSWLWPSGNSGPGYVRETANGHELYIHQRRPDMTVLQMVTFTRLFQETVEIDYGKYIIDQEIAELDNLDYLIAASAPTTLGLAA